MCDIEISLVLGHDTTSLDSWLRTFRDDIVFSSSRLDLAVKGNEISVTEIYVPEERKGPPH
jgi:hypothetical protein